VRHRSRLYTDIEHAVRRFTDVQHQ
jgi:hypothetical protein